MFIVFSLPSSSSLTHDHDPHIIRLGLQLTSRLSKTYHLKDYDLRLDRL